MAEILTPFLYLSLGFAMGAFWVWRRGSKARAGAIVSDLSAEWARHLADHAEAQKGSVVWTGPEVYVRPHSQADEIVRLLNAAAEK